MTDKAYIVANKQQEREVLEKLEREGMLWRGSGYKPTEKSHLIKDPITLFAKDDNQLTYDYEVTESYLSNFEIVYDGRKEGKMDKKYKVTQEFMNELIKWRDDMSLDTKSDFIDTFVDGQDIQKMPGLVDAWWADSYDSKENNNRLIAILQWLNGEDVFEVEAPHKFVVRSENDRLLLNAIKSERDERMKYIREITEMLTTLEMNDVEIHDKLRKHEVALNFAIGLAVGLLFSMILIAWQTLN